MNHEDNLGGGGVCSALKKIESWGVGCAEPYGVKWCEKVKIESWGGGYEEPYRVKWCKNGDWGVVVCRALKSGVRK